MMQSHNLSLRRVAKFLARCLAQLLIFPLLLWHWLWVPLLGADRCLQGSSEWLSLFPGVLGQYLRCAFYSWTLQECHPTASIGFGTIVTKVNCKIRANVYIGPGCHLGMVDIGENALLASGVHVTSGAKVHGIADPSIPIREQEGEFVQVQIGTGAWIGSNAVVMANVGEHAIIGAGAVVTRPIPPHSIAGGVPAKIIRSRLANSA